MFGSYGLPFTWYLPFKVVPWISEHFENICRNGVTLQEMNVQSCGQYALMYLKFKARGKSMSEFVNVFKRKDYVYNDHLVGEMIKPLLDWTVKYCKSCKQSNHNTCHLDI